MRPNFYKTFGNYFKKAEQKKNNQKSVDKTDDKFLLTLQCFEEIRGFYFSVHRHYTPLSSLDFARKE